MLSATELYVKGRHHDLLSPTSLFASEGALLLVQADGQASRTAMALTLSGRMKPGGGAISWNGDRSIAQLRRHAALLDAPGVNEPERHLSVKDLVIEDLALIPRRFRARTRPAAWLAQHDGGSLAGKWVDELPPDRRLGLLAGLALADAQVQLLVADSPDRHGGDPAHWLPLLQSLARGADDDGGGRALTVVATVASIPEGWDGPVARVGQSSAIPAPPEPEPQLAGAAVGPATESLNRAEESQDLR